MSVIVHRYPTENFILARSRCDNCCMELSLLDEIPLFSYLLLRGHCRYCKEPIASELFLFELVGGFAFCLIDFSCIKGILTSIFISSLFLTSISDFYKKEYDIFFLLPAIIVAFTNNKLFSFTAFDLISFILLTFIFGWSIFKGKIGLGDLLIYIILSIYFTPSVVNTILLVACLTLLLTFFIEQKNCNYQYPFLPFIFLGLVFTLLIK